MPAMTIDGLQGQHSEIGSVVDGAQHCLKPPNVTIGGVDTGFAWRQKSKMLRRQMVAGSFARGQGSKRFRRDGQADR